MEGSINELIRYRMDRANEMLVAAEENLKVKQYRTSLNRSYKDISSHLKKLSNIS